MEYSNRHVEAEKIKRALVAVANTGLGPHAMMVQFVYALSTGAAMRNAWAFPIITLLTSLLVI